MEIGILWKQNRSKKGKNKQDCYLIEYTKPRNQVRLKWFRYKKPRTKEEFTHNKNIEYEADQFISKRKLELRLGLYDIQDYTQEIESFVLWSRNYIDTNLKPKYEANTIHPYTKGLDIFEQFFTTGKTLVDFTEQQALDLKIYMRDKYVNRYGSRYSVDTINTYWNRLKKLCDYYIGQGKPTYQRKNMFLEVGYFKTKKKKREYVSLEEFHLLDPSLCVHTGIAKAFMFSCLTGLRMSDIQALTYKDILKDQIRGHYIEVIMVKGGDKIFIPLGKEEMNLVGRLGSDEEKVFRFSSAYYKYLYNWLKNAFPKKKVGQQRGDDDTKEGLTFHSARGSFITNMLDLGIPPVRVQKYVGHKDLKTTLSYYRGGDSYEQEDFTKFKKELNASKGVLKAKQLIS